MDTTAWDIWEKDFKKGDEVILIDDNTMFDWGILDYNDKEVILSSGKRPARHYPHHKIVFICHDGFPVRKFLGPWPHETFDAQLIPEVMRAALASENEDYLKKELKSIEKAAASLGITEKAFYDHPTVISALEIMKQLSSPFVTLAKTIKDTIKEKERKRIFYGHPVEFNPISVQLFNPGNSTTWFHSNHPQEEVLRMVAHNGLIGQLWDLEGVYHFEM